VRKFGKLFLALVLVGLVVFLGRSYILRYFFQPTPSYLKKGESKLLSKAYLKVVAKNLKIPWEVVFLPNKDLLLTERPGVLRRVGKVNLSLRLKEVEAVGEGGLLGMALHPQFKKNHWLYLYFTTKTNKSLVNRVVRYRFVNNRLQQPKIVVDQIPAGAVHNGGRIAFGPDGYLYITTGDAGQPQKAQDIHSLAGKILRVAGDGSVPATNPFGNLVYSYGHRNPQGITWDKKGRFWATEHGRSGALSGLDEVNLIKKGRNYGWPVIQGNQRRKGMQTPTVQSGPKETWAPAGLAYWQGALYFAGLRGESLYQAKIKETSSGKVKLTLKAFLRSKFGRLRAVVVGPDNFLYISTSNTDGRGSPRYQDDKVIKISPKAFH